MSEFDQMQDEAMDEDVEMASIAEEEDFDEKFSHQGTSTVSGKKKIVRNKLSDQLERNFNCVLL